MRYFLAFVVFFGLAGTALAEEHREHGFFEQFRPHYEHGHYRDRDRDYGYHNSRPYQVCDQQGYCQWVYR